jgi:hypothetical protein
MFGATLVQPTARKIATSMKEVASRFMQSGLNPTGRAIQAGMPETAGFNAYEKTVAFVPLTRRDATLAPIGGEGRGEGAFTDIS